MVGALLQSFGVKIDDLLKMSSLLRDGSSGRVQRWPALADSGILQLMYRLRWCIVCAHTCFDDRKFFQLGDSVDEQLTKIFKLQETLTAFRAQ